MSGSSFLSRNDEIKQTQASKPNVLLFAEKINTLIKFFELSKYIFFLCLNKKKFFDTRLQMNKIGLILPTRYFFKERAIFLFVLNNETNQS